MSLPITLTPVPNSRDAIADAIYRCVLGLDTSDEKLFKSAFTQDAIADFNGTTMNGVDAIQSQCYDLVAALDTSHFISNMRINISDGGSQALAVCSAMAQHYPSGKGMEADSTGLLASSIYWVDLVRDDNDGLWKIKKWKLKMTWASGDWGVMARE